VLEPGAIFRRLFGGGIDPALRPVLGVALAGSVAGSLLWSFTGIWAIKELGAEERQLGLAFLLGALAAAGGGYLGGHLSDHFGRRPLILVGWGFEALVALAFLAVGDLVLAGLGLIAGAAFFGSLGGAADQALVADLVPEERHEAAYASVRVASNLGVTIGPPIGGLLLLVSWPALFAGAAVLATATLGLALRFIPRRGAYAPPRPERGSFGLLVRDRLFLLFFASGCLATLVYVAYETVLPISLVDTHGMSASTWGFLLVVNPAMVTLFQLRLTARTARVPASLKLSVAMLLMGLPFLALTATGRLPVVALVIFVFVIGEMLWIPTSQTVVARIAPPDVRGAYIGAFSGTFAVGFALTPFLGLQVRDAAGDAAMWALFAGISVVASALGLIACAAAFGLRGTAVGPLEESATAA